MTHTHSVSSSDALLSIISVFLDELYTNSLSIITKTLHVYSIGSEHIAIKLPSNYILAICIFLPISKPEK